MVKPEASNFDISSHGLGCLVRVLGPIEALLLLQHPQRRTLQQSWQPKCGSNALVVEQSTCVLHRETPPARLQGGGGGSPQGAVNCGRF